MVAIKVYDIEEDERCGQSASVSRKMFFNEAHMVGMLQHPNIMPIYDAGERRRQVLRRNGTYPGRAHARRILSAR